MRIGFRRVAWQLAAGFYAVAAQGQARRPMVVDDIFALKQLHEAVLSPDGEWLAVVIVRARTNLKTYRDFPWDLDHADVWLVGRRDRTLRNLTHGDTNGTGHWNPIWSPDSKRLALLSTSPDGDIHVSAYDLKSQTLRQLTKRGADLLAIGDRGWPTYAMLWRDTTTVICAVRPEGAPTTFHWMSKIRSYTTAVEGWKTAEAGLEPSVSVLRSGPEVPDTGRPQGALLAINVMSGGTRVVAEGNFRQILPSPSRRYAAIIAETGRVPPSPATRLPVDNSDPAHDLRRTRLGLLRLDGTDAIQWVDNIPDPKIGFLRIPHSWSPDGSSFSVLAKSTPEDTDAGTLWLVSSTTRATRVTSAAELDVRASIWSNGGDLLALGQAVPTVGRSPKAPKLDWWRIPHGTGRTQRLAWDLKEMPEALLPTSQPHTMIGIASGDLWALDVRDGTTRNLTGTLGPSVQALEWPTPGVPVSGGVGEVLLRTTSNEVYRLDLERSAAPINPFPRPSAGATIAEFRPRQRVAVYMASQPDGAFLWLGDGQSKEFDQRVALNTQLGQIADAQRMLVRYRGVEGDSLKALLMLPVGYKPGVRYPLITYVYAGTVVSDTNMSGRFDKSFVSSLNVHLIPAHGYALLIPSMPLVPQGEAGDPYIDLPKGVMAAVDKVIDLGIADPQRLGVMGHSYGGYSTYTLVTYTQRFKAAIAMAGPSNLVSLYGSFANPLRYDEYAHELLAFAGMAESGQLRMGSPPWGDLWRYLRNSPMNYVDRVETPLMIVQGDMDFVPIEQGEEFFTALYRLGKPAEFVRYWGEGHIIASPANTRDLWRRTFEWFDEHLKGDKAPIRP